VDEGHDDDDGDGRRREERDADRVAGIARRQERDPRGS
jgi:hypothetical protein